VVATNPSTDFPPDSTPMKIKLAPLRGVLTDLLTSSSSSSSSSKATRKLVHGVQSATGLRQVAITASPDDATAIARVNGAELAFHEMGSGKETNRGPSSEVWWC
jgi:hypothetical protein